MQDARFTGQDMLHSCCNDDEIYRTDYDVPVPVCRMVVRRLACLVLQKVFKTTRLFSADQHSGTSNLRDWINSYSFVIP